MAKVYHTQIMEIVYAVDIGSLVGQSIGVSTFGQLVSSVVKNAFVLAGVISFILLVVGALGIITGAGSGDTKKMEGAKNTITAAVLGLIVVVGSIFIVKVLSVITGVDILSPKGV